MDMRFKHKHFDPLKASIGLLLAGLISLYCLNVHAEDINRVAVIYPEIREPYLSVFKEIKSGVDQSLNNPAETIMIDKETTAASLDTRLDEANIKAVITLGSGAYNFAEQLSTERSVVGGAVFTRPEPEQDSVASISMIVSPKMQFLQLREIAPEVKTIHVIYNTEQDKWLIDLAQVALEGSGIELDATATTGLKDKALAYQQLLEKNQLSNTDALWLLQGDRVSSESTILSQILKRAWQDRFVVFSANPSHVKRGALFATYPDNIGLGERLGQDILSAQAGEQPAFSPLTDLRIAFNARTAEHLELDISRSRKASFDLVFPNR